MIDDATSKIYNHVVGHSAFEEAFVKAHQKGRMHHAWLLTGPRGIGKSMMARRAAAWLMAENGQETFIKNAPKTFSIDQGDHGSNLVFKGTHPDLKVIKPEDEDNKSGQIKINQIRTLLPFMMHKPGRDGWRIAIVDSMDEVNRSGANAMLKLLEEPPERTVIFLIAARSGMLPPTIRSRCRVVRMEALSSGDCNALLAGILPEADTGMLNILSLLGEGAPGRAIMLAESGAADCYQAACAILAEEQLDMSALASISNKWGQNNAKARDARQGAMMLLDRLLRLAATSAAGHVTIEACAFERPVIANLQARHSAATLADKQANFMREAGRVDGLHADFAHFLLRQMTEIHQKTLP